jgi:hypothetical protein
MAFGITPARGPWEYRTFPKSQMSTLAQAAFSKGDLVCLDHGRSISVYTSTQSGYLGVALNASADSSLGITVAIPAPNCTAYVDSLTTDAASSFSLGQAASIITRYGRTSCLSMQPAGGASAFSYSVVVVGPMVSAESRIEVAFLSQNAVFYSASSSTLNN